MASTGKGQVMGRGRTRQDTTRQDRTGQRTGQGSAAGMVAFVGVGCLCSSLSSNLYLFLGFGVFRVAGILDDETKKTLQGKLDLGLLRRFHADECCSVPTSIVSATL